MKSMSYNPSTSCSVTGSGTFFDCLPSANELLIEYAACVRVEELQQNCQRRYVYENPILERTFNVGSYGEHNKTPLYIKLMTDDFLSPNRTSGWEHVVVLTKDNETGGGKFHQKREEIKCTQEYIRASDLVTKKDDKTEDCPVTKNENETKDTSSVDMMDESERLFKLFNKTIPKEVISLILSMRLTRTFSTYEEDIVGLDSVKQTIKEKVIYPIKRPELHCGLCQPPKGILFFGSPGTGKTMLAKWIATESRATFFVVTPSTLLSKFYGETEMCINGLFRVAEEYSPSILFIDEIDALMGRRQETDQDTNIRMKNQLLQGMDGAMGLSNKMIIIIGATNRPEVLDPAAVRRFVRRIMVPLPELQTRLNHLSHLLFHHHQETKNTQKYSLREDELLTIAKELDGWSASDIKTLCMRAADFPYQEALTSYGSVSNIPNAASFRPIEYQDLRRALSDVKPSSCIQEENRLSAWQTAFGAL